jgi:hypothetical protein
LFLVAGYLRGWGLVVRVDEASSHLLDFCVWQVGDFFSEALVHHLCYLYRSHIQKLPARSDLLASSWGVRWRTAGCEGGGRRRRFQVAQLARFVKRPRCHTNCTHIRVFSVDLPAIHYLLERSLVDVR